MVHHLNAASVRIWTYNKEQHVLELQASAGKYTLVDDSHSCIPLGQFNIGLIAEERTPYFTNAVSGDPRVHDQAGIKREKLVAFAGYPFVVEDRLVGVMAIFSRQQLSEATLQAVGTVTKLIALGIDQRQAEETFREGEDRFRQLARHSQEVFWCTSIDGHEMVYISPAYEEIWGRTCQSLYDQPTSWIDAILAEDQQRVREAFFGKAFEGIVDEEYQIVRPDGTIRWIRDRGCPVKNEAGPVDRIAGIAEDITDRLLADAALRESHRELERRVQERTNELHITNELLKDSRRKYKELYENAPDMVASVDQKSMLITQCTQTLTKQLGYSSEDIIGRPVLDLYHPDCTEGIHNALDVFAKTGESHNAKFQLKRKDGTNIDGILRVSVMRDKQGEILFSHSIWRDVSNRKRTEEKFRGLLEAAPDAMIIANTEGQIVLVNSQTEELFGYARKDLLGQPVEILIPARLRGSHSAHRADYSHNPCVRPMGAGRDLFGLRQDGTEFPAEISLSPLETEEGRLVISAIRDITARKRTEEKLQRQAEELARSNAELQQYAYIASHDLQEPLRGVAGCLGILERRYKDSLDASAHELITHAVGGACRMQALIEALLCYSKVGSRDQHFEPTDCVRILKRTLSDLHSSIQESGAVVTYDLLPEVSYHPTQLMQVFQNLISNALKFRREASPHIHVGVKRGDREWILWVQDHGIGIKPEYAKRIFVLFQRLHTRTKYSGTGIGLAICKKIVERHHGRIWFESEPGKGSTFFFTIPLG